MGEMSDSTSTPSRMPRMNAATATCSPAAYRARVIVTYSLATRMSMTRLSCRTIGSPADEWDDHLSVQG
jgi:hypothetical protein